LSPARDRLRLCITRLATAQQAAEAAAEPVRRCEAVESSARQLQAQLNALYKRDEVETGNWIAAGRVGSDPGDAVETRELNAKIAAMQDEVAAVRRVRPEKEAVSQAAAERVRAATAERDHALYAVATEAAGEIGADYTVALSEALRFEARMRSIAEALRERGNCGDNAALGAANQIIESITAARRAAAVERDAVYGPQLLDRLTRDPSEGLRP
jgi:hypothetical protein